MVRSEVLRLLLVVNAFASSVTARNRVVIHQALSRHHEVEVVETNRRGHAIRFAQDAARRGLDAVIAFGGDGTLNEVATGVSGSGTALGVLPGGSTNVFARSLGMPNDPIAAVHRLVAGLDAHDCRSIGLGQVNGRSFCFHTGIGFDAAVVAAVERYASVKRWMGHPLFIGAALRTWSSGYDRHRGHFDVEILTRDPGSDAPSTPDRVEDALFTVVLNTNPYTYLGNRPLDLSPEAGLDRSLVVVTFTSLRARDLLGSLLGALRGGGLRPADHLVVHTGVTSLRVSGDEPYPFQVDGDHLGSTTTLEMDYVPDAVNLVMPRDPFTT
jgi:diacylglycerol kinase family enzyme